MILSKINLKKRTIKMADDLTSKEYTPQELKDAFVKMYGGNEAEVRLYSSPARINIIGFINLGNSHV